MDMQAARTLMVDGQIRPNKVTDPRIIAAMRRLPRERFLPDGQHDRAYVDISVPLGGGRALMEPMVIARLVQATAIRPGDKALVVACGTGYGAALLAACGAQVTALEDDPALLAIARMVLPAEAPGVTLVEGPPAEGWPPHAVYDVILIEGAIDTVPPPLAAQLRRDGGRLLTVRRLAGTRLGHAVIAEPTPSGLGFKTLFDCTVAPLPGFIGTAAFAF